MDGLGESGLLAMAMMSLTLRRLRTGKPGERRGGLIQPNTITNADVPPAVESRQVRRARERAEAKGAK